MMLGGIPVHVDTFLGASRVQFRFPRSKKTRIRKKWRKRPENWKTVYEAVAYEINGQGYGPMLVCSPKYHEQLLEALEAERRSNP